MPDILFIRREFTPVDRAVNETKLLYPVPKGMRVLWASAINLIPCAGATTPTLTLGDGTDVDGYITTANLDLEAASGTLVGGSGALLATSGGKLYTGADTIDADYIAGATPGATTPRVAFVFAVVQEWVLSQ